MIKANQLSEFLPAYRYTDGKGITLDTIQNPLIKATKAYGIVY